MSFERAIAAPAGTVGRRVAAVLADYLILVTLLGFVVMPVLF
ncbi:hypothetical protein [Planomonospora venezuelensis]|uniref:Uncharacterized protein n=1 Tax=Planomonospora venezuelensis TaxID=1999 RepID=A0A841D0J5_PLAVE|nr:hypothetical protein [Planomonospora venezuelensis]MBB5963771.1 hypothetical protein [Planomonospora venezuelensis]